MPARGRLTWVPTPTTDPYVPGTWWYRDFTAYPAVRRSPPVTTPENCIGMASEFDGWVWVPSSAGMGWTPPPVMVRVGG